MDNQRKSFQPVGYFPEKERPETRGDERHSLGFRGLVFALCAFLVLSSVVLVSKLLEYRDAAVEYEAIAKEMNTTPSPAEKTPPPMPARAAALPAHTAIPDMTPTVYYNRDMLMLKGKNSDTVAYLDIPGTNIQYPVVRGKDNSYYTSHTFSKKKNASGAIFMDYWNGVDLTDFNIVLYGHNMKDGSMFHELLQYRKTAFMKEHRQIVLTGLHERKSFLIFSAYTCDSGTDVRGFRYDTVEERQAFLNVLANRSDIGGGAVTPNAREQIITLVTCRDRGGEEYFVVHGALIK